MGGGGVHIGLGFSHSQTDKSCSTFISSAEANNSSAARCKNTLNHQSEAHTDFPSALIAYSSSSHNKEGPCDRETITAMSGTRRGVYLAVFLRCSCTVHAPPLTLSARREIQELALVLWRWRRKIREITRVPAADLMAGRERSVPGDQAGPRTG